MQPGHVAEARRRLGDAAAALDDDALARALWVARALPVALDVLADTRAEPGLSAARLTSPEVLTRAHEAGALEALGALFPDSDELQVRFVRAIEPGGEAVALVRWSLSEKGAHVDGPPVIHRFVHGPRR